MQEGDFFRLKEGEGMHVLHGGQFRQNTEVKFLRNTHTLGSGMRNTGFCDEKYSQTGF